MSLQLKRTHPPRNIPWEERPWPAQLAIWTVSAAFVSLAWWQMFHIQVQARRSLFWIVAALILASSLSLSLVVARSSSEALPRRRVLAFCLSLLINTSLVLILSRVSVFAREDLAQRVEEKKKREEQQRQEEQPQQHSELIPMSDTGTSSPVPEELQPLRTGEPDLEDRDLVAQSAIASNERPEQETDNVPATQLAIKPQLLERQQVTDSAPRQFESEGLLSAQRQQAEPRLGAPEALSVPEPVSPERPMPSLADSATDVARIGAPELTRDADRAIPMDEPQRPSDVSLVLPEREETSEPKPASADASALASIQPEVTAKRETEPRPAPSIADTAVETETDSAAQAALTAPRPVETDPARIPASESASDLASATGPIESPSPTARISPAPLRRADSEASPQQVTANDRRLASRRPTEEPRLASRASSVSPEVTPEPDAVASPDASTTNLARAARGENRSEEPPSTSSVAESLEVERPALSESSRNVPLPRLRTSEDRPAETVSDGGTSGRVARTNDRTQRTSPSALATPVEVADAQRPAADENRFQPEPRISPETGQDERLSDAATTSDEDTVGQSVAMSADAADAAVSGLRSGSTALAGPSAVRRATDRSSGQAPDVTSNSLTDNTSSLASGRPRAVAADSPGPGSSAAAAAGTADASVADNEASGDPSQLAASLPSTRLTRPSASGNDRVLGGAGGDQPSDASADAANDTTLSLSDSMAMRESPLPRRQVVHASAAEGPPQIATDSASSNRGDSQGRNRLATRSVPSVALPGSASIARARVNEGVRPSLDSDSASSAEPSVRPPANSVVGRAAVAPPSLDATSNPSAAGGLEVDIPAVEGVGGFGPQRAVDLGVMTRKSQVESTQVVDGLARFIRRDSGGRVSVTTHAPLPAQAYRHRLNRRGDTSDPGDDPGAERTERAIELGLGYLTTLQAEDGSWSLSQAGAPVDGVPPDAKPTLESQTAATGLALLSFLGAGYHHQSDRHAETVRRGLDWLVQHQKNDGDLYVPQDRLSNRSAWLYSHGIAAIALCEAYGMTQDPQLRKPAQKAVDFIVISQHRRLGGWRYEPAASADTSVSGWMVMALRSAELANLDVPPETWERVGTWLDLARESPERPERYRYNPLAPDTPTQRHGRAPTKTITAVGLLMRLYLGWGRDQDEMKRGAEVLAEHLPEMGTASDPQRDTYYWYYATQVMFHMRGEHWAKWNAKLHPLLTSTQEQSGPLAGSWSPRDPLPDRWAIHAGRLYVTTLNLLSLEVNYRHLPIYEDMQREMIRRDE